MAIKRFFLPNFFFFASLAYTAFDLGIERTHIAKIRNAVFSCSFHTPPPHLLSHEDMYIFNAYHAKTTDRNEKFLLYEIFIATKQQSQIEAIFKKKKKCRQNTRKEQK